jgi:hypothetical protein
MLPLLFFEFVWKSIWVLVFGLSGRLDPSVSFGGPETLIACLVGIVLVPLVVPWGYVFKQYIKTPGDRWTKQTTASTPQQPGSPVQGTTGARM